MPHLLPYSASKFALVGFSEGLRAELQKDGVVVTTVCPGLMRTGSPVNATFKGQHRAEYAWFTISDSLPATSMAAERAARQIIRACKRGDAEVVLLDTGRGPRAFPRRVSGGDCRHARAYKPAASGARRNRRSPRARIREPVRPCALVVDGALRQSRRPEQRDQLRCDHLFAVSIKKPTSRSLFSLLNGPGSERLMK